MAGAAIPDVYAPPMPATTLGNMVKTFLQKILDITDDGKVYTFNLRRGVKWHNTLAFKATRDF